MKTFGKDLVISALMGLVLPGILLNFAAAGEQREGMPLQGEEYSQTAETIRLREQVPVLVRTSGGQAEEMELEEYLVGVVLAEMPVSFAPEALKAQAVVARTYARKAFVTGGKHEDGSVCVLPVCCQGYLSGETYLAAGGTRENLEKVRSAVESTAGQVLTYEGGLIEATYFSCSGGNTEPAVAVWGTDYPYLQTVESPGEESAAYFSDTVVFSKEELETMLGVSLSGKSSEWIGEVSYTEGGGVDMLFIAGTCFRGTQLRSLLGLRSTAFSIHPGENGVSITTRGYGHRVGMSQYGADAMATGGSTYQEILSHYYPGTELREISEIVDAEVDKA